MNKELFHQDAYLRKAEAQVIGYTDEGAIILDRSLFYATGGGQPGDSGILIWNDNILSIASARKTDHGEIALVPAEVAQMPPVGARVMQKIDWDRRFSHMRMHTALHLLSVVIPLPVTGGSISAEKGRLDFNMPEAPPDKETLETQLNELIACDLPVETHWITAQDLDANPQLVKTMSVSPPRGAGHIRLIAIGKGDEQIDLQPCGGTHVARTGEIGGIKFGKIEKKGRLNRRVNLLFDY